MFDLYFCDLDLCLCLVSVSFLFFRLCCCDLEFLVAGFVFLVAGFDLGRTRRTSCNVLRSEGVV